MAPDGHRGAIRLVAVDPVEPETAAELGRGVRLQDLREQGAPGAGGVGAGGLEGTKRRFCAGLDLSPGRDHAKACR